VQTFVAGDAYVLQSPASHLYRQREHIQKALEFGGPAIFSVFVPFTDESSLLRAYLVSAAAMESRVFPAFSYNPAAGKGLVDRFDISCNPDVDIDWPRRELHFEDEKLQAVAEEVAFTAVDFALIDSKYGSHFALAAKDAWQEGLLPVADYIDSTNTDTVAAVPSVAAVNSDNVLQRLVVDEQLIRMARRCRERWHSLQELGGVHNSYANAAEQVARDALAQAETESAARAELAQAKTESVARTVLAQARTEPAVVDEAIQPAVVEALQPVAEPEQEADVTDNADEAFIETPRCTTCDECTNRNDRMFAYDENKQAYIKDIDAGTYRDLVEAAEICQVAIIHPGVPRNPAEPGLDELIERAESFR
jgi:hypothetical protein